MANGLTPSQRLGRRTEDRVDGHMGIDQSIFVEHMNIHEKASIRKSVSQLDTI